MPFVRFSRDRRGYEHIYLVHTPVRRGKAGRPRVLYWYRTPPGVKVGREAFDETIRRALEAQHPDVEFDWESLAAPPPPPQVVEPWRERRRLQKARKSRVAETESDTQLDHDLEADGQLEAEGGEAAVDEPFNGEDTPVAVAAAVVPASEMTTLRKGRRRRRGGRRRQEPAASSPHGLPGLAEAPPEPLDAAPSAALADPPGTDDSAS